MMAPREEAEGRYAEQCGQDLGLGFNSDATGRVKILTVVYPDIVALYVAHLDAGITDQ